MDTNYRIQRINREATHSQETNKIDKNKTKQNKTKTKTKKKRERKQYRAIKLS